MPAITRFTPQVSVHIPQQKQASAEDMGAGVARAYGARAHTFDQISAQAGHIKAQADQVVLDGQVLEWNKQMAGFRLEGIQRAEDLSRVEIPQGKSLPDLYGEDFDTRAKALNIPPAIKARAEVELANMRTHYISGSIGQAARRAGIAAKENWQEIVTLNANIAALDPSQQDSVLSQLATAAGGLSHLTPEERAALFNDGRQAVRGAVAESLIARSPSDFIKQAKAGTWNDLKNMPRYLERAQNDVLKAQMVAAKAKEEEDITAGYDDPDVLFDPGSKETNKIAGLVFERDGGLQALQQGENEGANILMAVATRTGVVPDNARGSLRAMMSMGSAEQKAYAFDVIARLQEDAPQALASFNDKEIAQAVMYNQMVRRGVDQQTALKKISEDFDPLNQPVMDMRKAWLSSKEGKDFLKSTAKAGNFTDLFDEGLFDWEPDMPRNTAAADSMIADYREALKSEYMTHGDVDVAKERARNQMYRLYGVSRVNGRKSVMKYPPEHYYAIPGLDHDWMQDQLLEDVKALDGDISLKNIELLPDHVTAADVAAGRPPRYQILINKDGLWDGARDTDGTVLYYQFEPQRVLESMSDKAKTKRREAIKREYLWGVATRMYKEMRGR